MTVNESEEWVDKLVVGMECSLEKDGVPSLKNRVFYYGESTCQELNLTQEQVNVAINKSVALGLIEKFALNRNNGYRLTEEGRARARSCMLRKNDGETGHSVIINGNNANVQIGNDNVQNISNVFKFMIEQIDKSNATKDEKRGAKEYLKKFIEHPLVNTILGTAGGALTSLL